MQKLLDLLVYAPAGLAQSAAEEFERLAEKGRHRVEGQLHTARLVGQFAVQMARREAEKGLRGAFERLPRGHEDRGAPLAGAGPGVGAEGTVPQDRAGAGASRPDGPGQPSGGDRPGPSFTANGSQSASKLAIPGYDSLSASHVVQRLGGLSDGELEDVREHELAHRHRRTILNRVDQLLAERGAGNGTVQS